MVLSQSKGRRFESALSSLFFACALISILTTVAVIVILLVESFRFFQTVSPIEFFFGTEWSPLIEPESYGVLPLVSGTLAILVGAAFVALPFGLAVAMYLSEYASAGRRRWFKPILEVLAGIPTVVYGYFALTTISPLLRSIFPETQLFNAASAAIVVGIMILPMVAMATIVLTVQPPGFEVGIGVAKSCWVEQVTTSSMVQPVPILSTAVLTMIRSTSTRPRVAMQVL